MLVQLHTSAGAARSRMGTILLLQRVRQHEEKTARVGAYGHAPSAGPCGYMAPSHGRNSVCVHCRLWASPTSRACRMARWTQHQANTNPPCAFFLGCPQGTLSVKFSLFCLYSFGSCGTFCDRSALSTRKRQPLVQAVYLSIVPPLHRGSPSCVSH